MSKKKQVCEKCGKETGILYFLPSESRGVCEKCLDDGQLEELGEE